MINYKGAWKTLIDKSSRFSFTREVVSKLAEKTFLNSLKDRSSFDAVILRVDLLNDRGRPRTTSDDSLNGVNVRSQSIWRAYVRPLDMHDMTIPEPCGFKDKGTRDYVISLHPIALSEILMEDGVNNNTLQAGDVVTVKLLRGPDNPKGMQGFRFDPRKVGTFSEGVGRVYACPEGGNELKIASGLGSDFKPQPAPRGNSPLPVRRRPSKKKTASEKAGRYGSKRGWGKFKGETADYGWKPADTEIYTYWGDYVEQKNGTKKLYYPRYTPVAELVNWGRTEPCLYSAYTDTGEANEASDDEYWRLVLKALGTNVTTNKIRFFNAWARKEGTGMSAANNPFASAWRPDGIDKHWTCYSFSRPWNGNKPWIINYSTPAIGATATARTIKLNHYKAIHTELMKSDPQFTETWFKSQAVALAYVTWGSGSGIAKAVKNKKKIKMTNSNATRVPEIATKLNEKYSDGKGYKLQYHLNVLNFYQKSQKRGKPINKLPGGKASYCIKDSSNATERGVWKGRTAEFKKYTTPEWLAENP